MDFLKNNVSPRFAVGEMYLHSPDVSTIMVIDLNGN